MPVIALNSLHIQKRYFRRRLIRARVSVIYPWQQLSMHTHTQCEKERLVHTVCYIPSVKSLGWDRPFANHPFLLCYILGKDYVQHSRHLEKLCRSIINERDYYQLLEMIILQLYQAKAQGDKTPTGHEGACYSTGRRDSHWSWRGQTHPSKGARLTHQKACWGSWGDPNIRSWHDHKAACNSCSEQVQQLFRTGPAHKVQKEVARFIQNEVKK